MHLASPPQRVFEALATDAGRARFWADATVEQDGQVHFRFANGYACTCRIVEARAAQAFALEYFEGVARFTLRADGAGGTDLELVHEGVSEPSWAEVHAGWLNVLFPLKAWLDHGVDLRNHDRARTWDGYADG